MTPKTRIAVLVAALFLGAQAGIAALNQEAADATAEAAESTEAVETAEATATEPAATEAPEATAAAEQPAVEVAEPATVRVRHVPLSATFPRSPDGRDMLPGLAAYLEQREAAISHLVARGDAFPTPSGSPMLPALASYLDQKEAQLIAQLEREMQPASATPVALAAPQAARSN